MLYGLVLGLIALPLLSGLLLVVFTRRVTINMARRITLVSTGITTLCALGLFPFLNSQAQHTTGNLFAITWLPGTGQIGLQLGDTGLMMVLVTSGSLFLTQLIFTTGTQTAQQEHFSLAVTLVALAAANIAFLSSNFLGRYVALEVVGLCIALAPLLEFSDGMHIARYIYLALRVGDAGFLAAILLLIKATGTPDITSALEAGTSLPLNQLSWIVAGFVLAIWVKSGIWPLHGWIQAGEILNPTSSGWLYRIVMPNLGLYLLYRITPLLTAGSKIFRDATFGLSLIAMAMALLILLQRKDTTKQWPTIIGAFLGGIALCCATRGMKNQVWWLAVAFAPLQMISSFVISKLSLTNILPVEIVKSTVVLPRTTQLMYRIAQEIRRIIEVSLLERLITNIPHAILNTSRWFYQVIEHNTLENILYTSAHTMLSVGRCLQRWHTGRLRVNLGWVIIALVIAVVFIIN